jgi:C1A family cysteine protease
MKTFALALTATAVTAFSDVEFKFMNYIAKFGKVIENLEEFETRLAHFIKSETEIEAHNATEANFKLGHNQFSDRSHEEYSSMLGFVNLQDAPKNVVVLDEANAASEVNWVTAGAVTDVKNQGSCGSCWSFSTTGSLEGAHFVSSGKLEAFSEQQLVDCAYGASYGSYGCNGGSMDGAMIYYETYNAELETVYPYVSGNSTSRKTCQYSAASDTDVAVSTKADVTADSISQLKAAVAKQPVSIAIEADKRVFQSYTSGVLDSTSCGTNLDHGVLIVGYGTDEASGLDYWLVKNSWDTVWGDQGYIKIAQVEGQGICGIQMAPVYPTSN